MFSISGILLYPPGRDSRNNHKSGHKNHESGCVEKTEVLVFSSDVKREQTDCGPLLPQTRPLAFALQPIVSLQIIIICEKGVAQKVGVGKETSPCWKCWKLGFTAFLRR